MSFRRGRAGFDSYWVLRYKAWWVAVIVASYLALPAIVTAAMPGKRLRDCNLGFEGFRRHFWIYVGLYGAVLPVIWLVSLTPEFYTFYPMYPQAGRSWFDLLSWEALYAGQFIALEFFFRGFLVGGLSRFLGALAVPVCVMPYLMIHFTKPWPEAAAFGGCGIRAGLAGMEDEVDLGRRVRALRGRVHDGSAGAGAQRAIAVAALIGRCWKNQRRGFGGAGRNRTADKGFADLCLTTWRPRRSLGKYLRRDSIIASRRRRFPEGQRASVTREPVHYADDDPIDTFIGV